MQARHSEPVSAHFDIIIIGAGIAGASAGAYLAPHASVLLLEMEGQPGYHTTGRSAALFVETYGPAAIRALTRASTDFFDKPPAGFAAHPLLSQRGTLLIAREDQLAQLESVITQMAPVSKVQRLNRAQTQSLAPLLRNDYAAAAMYEPDSRDIDVHALHHGFLKMFRAGAGQFQANSQVIGLTRVADCWQVETPTAHYRCNTIVNAAGAWADQIGALAGARAIGLVPKRRTALMVKAPPDNALNAMPAVVDVDEQFYLKPDAGRLLLSPADETPSAPCDAQPDEMDIALCVERIQQAFNLPINRIESKWAGLRSFVTDKSPVCGFDPRVAGLFWLAGQGGYGIQSAPALGQLAAALVLEQALPSHILDQGLSVADIDPKRLPHQ